MSSQALLAYRTYPADARWSSGLHAQLFQETTPRSTPSVKACVAPCGIAAGAFNAAKWPKVAYALQERLPGTPGSFDNNIATSDSWRSDLFRLGSEAMAFYHRTLS